MMTTNKLTKTFASGSLAIGVLASAVLTATCANAAQVSATWLDFKNGTSLSVGDKKVTYVDIGVDDDVIGNNDEIELMEVGDEYQVLFTPKGSPFSVSAAFSYTIEITDPDPLKYFKGVQLDSDVSVNIPFGYGKVEKTLAEVPGLILTSTNGLPDPNGDFSYLSGHLRKLTVTDKTTPNTSGTPVLNSLSNKFLQATEKVPEPGTILGLLAVGGLGLVSRFNKQK